MPDAVAERADVFPVQPVGAGRGSDEGRCAVSGYTARF